MKALVLPLLVLALPAQEAKLAVWPSVVIVDDVGETQRVTALAQLATGATVDRGNEVSWHVESPDLADVVRDGGSVRVHGRRAGDGTLVATLGRVLVRVPLHVRHRDPARPVSFANEVLPILTRAGCNAGSCHGAAAGKNGFGLSLFGFDPARDHLTLTHDLRARRVDLAEPDQSLVLQKATARVPHKGNQRFTAESPLYARLRSWIAAGAPNDLATATALTGIELMPTEVVLVGKDRTLPLQLRAHYADDSVRDVTEWVLWSSNNDGVASVDGAGLVTTHEPGEACVLARYGGMATVARVRVLANDAPFPWPAFGEESLVDRHLHEKQRAAHVVPAPLCSDEVFVRRIWLDLLGVLPTVAEAREFLADPAPDKRARLVDRLLERPEFAAAQAMAWAEVLQVDTATMEPKGAALLSRWLADAFATRRPFDAVVRELLTANGSGFATPAANFWLAANQPNLMAEKVAQNFLGVRMQCAQCHNHPFENWTMNDYYGFAAFFAQVGRKRGEDPYEQVVWDQRSGDVRNKRDDKVAVPRALGAPPATVPQGTDRRAVLASWLTAPENPWFAKNVVNRLWARLMGRGIVDPPDDVRVSNPASHPALLGELADLLVANHYDVRVVVRAICTSKSYQLGRHEGTPERALFAGNLVRRLSAEQLLDAIGAVTGVPTKYPGVPLGAPATTIANGNAGVRFLSVFGRPVRDSACTCDRRVEPTLSQALHLINGETIAGKINDGNGRLRRALKAKQPATEMLDELFLAAYSRTPSAAERETLLALVTGDGDKTAAWQDLYWAVLNSKEFTFQH